MTATQAVLDVTAQIANGTKKVQSMTLVTRLLDARGTEVTNVTKNISLQPSFTETFNVVTADGVAEGIPSVVGEVIEWAPRHWVANSDNTDDIARVGRHLLQDPHAAEDGVKALTAHNVDGVTRWKRWIGSKLI